MTGFKSVHDYQEFANAVRSKRRFIHSEEVAAFLHAVSNANKDREAALTAGTTLWRAQTGSREWQRSDDSGHEWVEDAPFPPERMIPPIRNPLEGRINPRGIAYLYLATDRKTAISEVRPWSGSLVSVAVFETTRDLRLVDCSKNHGKAGGWSYLLDIPENQWDKLSPEQIEQAVWADIDNAFSRPVGPDDEYLNYVPTQIIAESFVGQDFDGIAYKSALSENGYNVALFDVNAAEFRSCQLFNVTRAEYEFEECANPWFLRDGKYFTNVITDMRPAGEPQSADGSDEDATDDNIKDAS